MALLIHYCVECENILDENNVVMNNSMFLVKCDICGRQGKIKNTKQDAIDSWNEESHSASIIDEFIDKLDGVK